MDIPWDDMKLFLAVAEGGSMSVAARRLSVAQPTVSRRLAELESQLGEPLFLRGVDGARLTAFGERLVEPARRMAEWAGELTRAAERSEAKPSGVVRITTAPGLAFDLMAPFAVWLKKKLPEIVLEVVSTVHYLDLVRREADLALRFQRPTQRDLVVVESITVESAAFASRKYIESLPKGYQIADVDWIGWAPPFENLAPNPQLAARIPGFRPTFASDDFLVQLRAAEEGAGAIFLARLKHRFSGKTNLEELDLDFGLLRSETCLVCAKSALEIPRVRAVADLLAAELAAATLVPSSHEKVKPSARARGGRR